MNKYFIGIDSGTTSIKAVLFDLQGNELAKEAQTLVAICPREDMYEEDMYEIWDKAVKCVRSLAERYPKDEIVGIGVTAQGDGLWLIDEAGEPVRNGMCFCDGRASEFVDMWVKDGMCDELFRCTGTRIFTGNQNGIVRWMDKYEKESLNRSRWFLHLKDYLFYKMTGKITSDASDESLIMLDQKKRDYLDKAFELTGISEYRSKYPPVLPAKENSFNLSAAAAEIMGLSTDVIVTSGPMDVAACALASGVVENGHCCSIIGTAALHEMCIDEPLKDNIMAGMTVAHAMEDRWLRLMASLAGTPNLEWMLDTMGHGIREAAKKAGQSVYAYMEQLLDSVPIGSNGIMYHPYILSGGERAPFTDSRARGSFTGISSRNTSADIVRATYEGVAFAMLDCYQNMPQEVKSVAVCGGGANSKAWCQMFADALGTKIVTVAAGELGALGVVINNAVVQGYYNSYKEAVDCIVKVDKIYAPNMENHEKYMRFYELYRLTREQLSKTWKLRAELVRGN
jgi:sugar (pentulose or hexulose) kinase